MSRKLPLFLVVGLMLGLTVWLYRTFRPTLARGQRVWQFFSDPASHPELVIAAGTRCNAAPFIFPTTGLAGFIWDDSFRPSHRHQGIDIFARSGSGETPVLAAFPGFLTRLPAWKASVIVRVPDDPLAPGRQMWVYYTHMADADGNSFIAADFPPGTSEKPVAAGDFLGYQGNYSGDPRNPVGVHLHISIVKDNAGRFTNELDIRNTYDPSPYFGLALNAHENPETIPTCEAQP
ncbi:MAG: hypothetical protein CO094_01675 [Anaerolineae bacterium CG_4_9_14_3_um_filter_57_17]|nr:M23 family metallopeptidase [bacterium]NCT19963.1 M23 family metallopeptidase [bacterium]OIO84034.1 MAG: hypothetical protein AUK01_11195 [Anaerolineae bacterium CG2_30_57_67]PJB68286.1 MAG: hypothetical protein CO094_01675 [Anaerolineae bacterium CG_4_9_14_3_um_filter_57_17]